MPVFFSNHSLDLYLPKFKADRNNTDRQTNTHTDIKTYRLNRPWSQLSENPAHRRPLNLSRCADNSTNATTLYHKALPEKSSTQPYHCPVAVYPTTYTFTTTFTFPGGFTLHSDEAPNMEKYNWFTHTRFEPKLFYPKKCVNCNKCEFEKKERKISLQKVQAKQDRNTSIDVTNLWLVTSFPLFKVKLTIYRTKRKLGT